MDEFCTLQLSDLMLRAQRASPKFKRSLFLSLSQVLTHAHLQRWWSFLDEFSMILNPLHPIWVLLQSVYDTALAEDQSSIHLSDVWLWECLVLPLTVWLSRQYVDTMFSCCSRLISKVIVLKRNTAVQGVHRTLDCAHSSKNRTCSQHLSQRSVTTRGGHAKAR